MTTGTLRVIGGQWRGRKLQFPALPGVRPSADRVRETLFNWLAPWIDGASCLDLFAGSGALGIEALSRGAHDVVFLDRTSGVTRALETTLSQLTRSPRSESWTVVCADALAWLQSPQAGRRFDIVFLDPPFASDLLAQGLAALQQPGWLTADAFIYFEADRQHALPTLPPHWSVHRHKQTGQVQYGLIHARTA